MCPPWKMNQLFRISCFCFLSVDFRTHLLCKGANSTSAEKALIYLFTMHWERDIYVPLQQLIKQQKLRWQKWPPFRVSWHMTIKNSEKAWAKVGIPFWFLLIIGICAKNLALNLKHYLWLYLGVRTHNWCHSLLNQAFLSTSPTIKWNIFT